MSGKPGTIGLEAFEQRRWGMAYEILTRASATGDLAAPDLQRLATAAQLTGRDEEAAGVMARAQAAYLKQGRLADAAYCAFWLAYSYMDRGEMAQAGGWLARAGRHAEEAGDCPAAWYVRMPEVLQLLDADPAAAAGVCEAIASAGQRLGDADLAGLGRLGRGQALVRLGRTVEGAAWLDDAMVSVVTDELSAMVSGIVYCAVVETCTEMFDLARAQEWTAALTAWCERQPDLVPFRGRCRVYRAEVMQLHGDWSEAISEAEEAGDSLAGHPALGAALYCQGELHRLRGNLDEADRAFKRAEERGRRPEPGLALVRLAQGRVQAAATAIRYALDESAFPPRRAALLPAATEIMLAAGEPLAARDCADELATIAASFGQPLLLAAAERCLGAVELAEGDGRRALDHLRRALDLWQSLAVPYEAARTRELVARAATATGDDETARVHLEAARAAYEQLGARGDHNRLGGVQVDAGELTPREMEVLRLVASGMTNRAIARTLVISEKTAANHVSNILGKLELSSRAAATAYAYERGLV